MIAMNFIDFNCVHRVFRGNKSRNTIVAVPIAAHRPAVIGNENGMNKSCVLHKMHGHSCRFFCNTVRSI